MLLPRALREIEKRQVIRPDLVVAAWPEVIGKKLAPMTEATVFDQGVLHVKVKNSTLHGLLAHEQEGRLLKELRKRFPGVEIRKITFRIG
jgi:hypothetical protein